MIALTQRAGLRPGWFHLRNWPGRPIATHHTSNFFARVAFKTNDSLPPVVVRVSWRGGSAHRLMPECAGPVFFISRLADHTFHRVTKRFKSVIRFLSRPGFHDWNLSREDTQNHGNLTRVRGGPAHV